MKIIDFINLESQRNKYLDNNNKALALIQSINVEIESNNSFNVPSAINDTIAMVNLMDQTEYMLELRVARHLLEYYRDNESFNMRIMPFPDTKEDNERFNTIKEHLQRIFND
jgi:hypothetical protein